MLFADFGEKVMLGFLVFAFVISWLIEKSGKAVGSGLSWFFKK